MPEPSSTGRTTVADGAGSAGAAEAPSVGDGTGTWDGSADGGADGTGTAASHCACRSSASCSCARAVTRFVNFSSYTQNSSRTTPTVMSVCPVPRRTVRTTSPPRLTANAR